MQRLILCWRFNSAKSVLIPFVVGIPHRTTWKSEMRYDLLHDLHNNKKSILMLMPLRYLREPRLNLANQTHVQGHNHYR